MQTFLTVMIIAIVTAIPCTFMVEVLQQDLIEAEAEGKCIRNYISRGIERRDIVARDGICYVVTQYDVIEKGKRLHNGAYL